MSKNVLIVDDEPNIVISLEFLMEQAGYTTAVARTGDEALARIADFAPDLILLDVMLPGMSGFDICQTVRQTPDWQHIKIIMLTAKGRDVEVSKGLALGANAYITKPFSTKALMAEVQEQLTDHAATKR
ncbi:MAG: response regulator [Caldilineaceae bacterium]|nr:response regulator [Caldilineaceae bacterium]